MKKFTIKFKGEIEVDAETVDDAILKVWIDDAIRDEWVDEVLESQKIQKCSHKNLSLKESNYWNVEIDDDDKSIYLKNECADGFGDIKCDDCGDDIETPDGYEFVY